MHGAFHKPCDHQAPGAAGFPAAWRRLPRILPVFHLRGAPDAMGRRCGTPAGEEVLCDAQRITGALARDGLPEPFADRVLDQAWSRIEPHAAEPYRAGLPLRAASPAGTAGGRSAGRI